MKLLNLNVLDFFAVNKEKFHFALFDPPYEINHLGGWDKSGITHTQDLWQPLYDAMLPGAYVLAYNYPGLPLAQMTVAAAEAGFAVHRTIFGWLCGQSMPLGHVKAQRGIEKHINKVYGGECKCKKATGDKYIGGSFFNPEDNSYHPVQICTTCERPVMIVLETKQWAKSTGMSGLGGPGFGANNVQTISKPMYKESEALKPYAYGKAVIRPTLEPIGVFQKPFDGAYAEGVLRYGTGIVNVMEGRASDTWPSNFYVVSDKDIENGFSSSYPVLGEDALEYISFMMGKRAGRKERDAGMPEGKKNNHTSVKPMNANRYFAKLFLPPSEIVDNPKALSIFSGSGSEAIALEKEGWNVTAIELESDYCDIAFARAIHHLGDDKEIWYVSNS